MSTIETLTTEVEAAQAADTTARPTRPLTQALSDFVNSLPSSQDREGLPEHREVSMYYRCEGGIRRTDREPQIEGHPRCGAAPAPGSATGSRHCSSR